MAVQYGELQSKSRHLGILGLTIKHDVNTSDWKLAKKSWNLRSFFLMTQLEADMVLGKHLRHARKVRRILIFQGVTDKEHCLTITILGRTATKDKGYTIRYE